MANNHTTSNNISTPDVDSEAQFNELDDKLRTLIHTLFTLQSLLHSSSTSSATPQGAPLSSANASASLTSTISTLPSLLSSLSSSAPDVPIPPEVLQYVDSARNPDIYTREFVELVQRNGAYLKGKGDALSLFRSELLGQLDVLKEGNWRGVELGEYAFLR